MEVHLTPEQQHQLAELASQRGRDADALAQEAISRYLAEEARFIEAVKLGEAALQRGEYLTHEQVGERLNRLFRPRCRWKSGGQPLPQTICNPYFSTSKKTIPPLPLTPCTPSMTAVPSCGRYPTS